MRNIRFILILSLILSLSLSLFGCKPSYSKDNLTEQLVLLCAKESKKEVQSYLIGNTLYTILEMKDALNSDLRLSEDTLDAIQNVMMCANRVSLSTDEDLKFFVVIIFDSTKNIEIIFSQYVEDVRRWMLGNISRNDFYSRSLTDIKVKPKGYSPKKEILNEITIPEFIGRQVVLQVKREMEENILIQVLINFEHMDWAFKEDENGPYFEYTVFRIEKNDKVADKGLGADESMGVVDLITQKHDEVSKKYQFTNYKGIVIKTDDGKQIFSSLQ